MLNNDENSILNIVKKYIPLELWRAAVTLYCSQPSTVFWLAGVSDEYMKKITIDDIKNHLGKSSLKINSTRDVYYRIHGFSEKTFPKSLRLSDESVITVHSVDIVLDNYLKANSRYSVIHFCENEYGVVSELNLSANSEWDVQENQARDIFLGIWLESAPKLFQKLNLACAVAELLKGSPSIKERVISDVGVNCADSAAEIRGRNK